MIASSSKPLLRWPCSSTSLNSSSLKLGRRSHHIARSSQDDIPHNIVVYDLHDTVIPYEEAWRWQKSLVEKVIETPKEGFLGYIVILQHDPVYTLGEGSTVENLKFDMDAPPFPLYRIERGGEVTYHGPGQLVMYPIINLKMLQTDLHWYLRNLEEMIIRSLDMVSGIQGRRINGLTGVWVDDRKVAAIGIRASKWVTYHGIALNVTTDLSPFQNIVPCGIDDKEVTRVSDMVEDHDDSLLIEYRYGLLEGFASAFGVDSSGFLEITGQQALDELSRLIY